MDTTQTLLANFQRHVLNSAARSAAAWQDTLTKVVLDSTQLVNLPGQARDLYLLPIKPYGFIHNPIK
jgi:hypothetical protein